MRRWLFALLIGLLAAALRMVLQPVLGDELPFIIAVPATALAALSQGAGPALLAAAIPMAAALIPGIPPELSGPRAASLCTGFAICALLLSLVGLVRRQGARDATYPASEPGSLGSWLRGVLLGAVLIPLTAFVGIAWWALERAKVEAESTAAHASQLALEHAQKTLEVARDIARATDEATIDDDETLRASEGRVHQRLADLARGAPAILNMNVWDAEGSPLAGSDLYPVDPQARVNDRAYFTQQRDRAFGVGISEVLTGRQSGKRLFNLVLRRSSADERFRGVVAISLSPDHFSTYYKSLVSDQPNLASFALLRTDGEILARWPPTPDGRTRALPDSPTLRSVQAGSLAGIHLLPQSQGREERLVSYRRLPGYPLYVAAGFSTTAMFAGWTRFLAILGAVMAPITAGLAWVAWVALRKTQQEQARSRELREQVARTAIAEKGALESQRLETLAVLTAGVAHDFNNVLAIVHNTLHLQRLKHPEQADEPQLKAMARAVNTGSRLTRQLMSFSRKQALKVEGVTLQSWLPSIQGLLETSLTRGVYASIDVSPDTSSIEVDVAELELAVLNLVVNANHALPRGGTIRIVAGNAPARTGCGPMVVIAVKDEGVGIAADVLPKVTEPFFSTRARGVGSGLGLSQVRGFCEHFGGALEIASEVGRGTEARMVLPAGAVTAHAEEVHGPVETEFLEGELLLVEDNDDLASTLATMLREAGLVVHRCRHAREALDHLATAEAKAMVALCDVAMPGDMDGIALAYRLRQDHPSLTVLLMTGYTDRLEDAVRGGFEVLPKPTPPAQLLRRLREVFSRG